MSTIINLHVSGGVITSKKGFTGRRQGSNQPLCMTQQNDEGTLGCVSKSKKTTAPLPSALPREAVLTLLWCKYSQKGDSRVGQPACSSNSYRQEYHQAEHDPSFPFWKDYCRGDYICREHLGYMLVEKYFLLIWELSSGMGHVGQLYCRFKIKYNQLMNRIMIRLPVTAKQNWVAWKTSSAQGTMFFLKQ